MHLFTPFVCLFVCEVRIKMKMNAILGKRYKAEAAAAKQHSLEKNGLLSSDNSDDLPVSNSLWFLITKKLF